LVVAGVIARLTRTAMLDTLSEDFVRLARAKGLPKGRVIYEHAFLAAFARVVPVIGLQAGFVLGGAIYIETVFQWPGLGKLLVDSILQRDFLLAQGAVLVVATCYVLVNLTTDLLQRALDPRLRS
jgi:peptide/nickel transport system permease protein